MTDNEARTPELERRTVGLLAAAAGLFVASIYYNQAHARHPAREFGTDAAGISSVAVLTQVGYAVGLLLLAPLATASSAAGLIALTSVALALALALAAAAPSLGFLAVASLGVGLLATVAQAVVPMAAQLAPDHMRGRVVGTVMAGVLTGILLARTVSGVVSQYASWRIMFGLSAAPAWPWAWSWACACPGSRP
jgi:MFS family permease